MGDAHVGLIDGSDRRNLHVTYDEAWSTRADATPLSVTLPLAARAHSGKRVANYLWGLLPDSERVLNRWARDYQCSPTDVFSLLCGVGADVAGAASYLIDGVTPPAPTSNDLQPLSEHDVATLIRSLRADGSTWHAQARGRWSLAGAQAKVALAFDDVADTWAIPVGTSPTTHILKPAIAGLDHHDLNEHLCLSAARLLGLPAAVTSIRQFEDQTVLVVERFDRLRRNGRVIRVHQEDFCQALGVHPEQKYQAEGGPSVEEMATLLRELSSGTQDSDVAALLRSVAFNWLVLGTDAHAKNFSLLLSGPQVRFAPLYDIASAAPYGDHPRKLRLAQKIAGEYRPTAIESRHWSRLATAVGLNPDHLHTEILTLATQLPDALANAVASSTLPSTHAVAETRIVNAIGEWSERCINSLAR
jgi:serine/threonine-protein kinase HipA